MATNLAALTKSHKIIASKKRAKREQIKEIVFDDTARREFLTGFHKRKLQKKETAIQRAKEREKQERLEARREKRKMLAERAVENAAEIERAYGAVLDEGGNEQWGGVGQGSASGSPRPDAVEEEEYEHEEELATVTIVEDFDPDALIHGTSQQPPRSDDTEEMSQISPPQLSSTKAANPSEQRPRAKGKEKAKTDKVKAQTKVVRKAKDIKYQTNAERKVDRLKQRKRKLEKAERAGGKASRNRPGKKR
ncbi:hypothetical protein OBBRIDRAFT_44109 [Obba rivulosa]|uniref:Nucleolar protein 12 n=1 Tax=Obba rivulosa TaxID=1052685 RepID=A0A8E2ATJ3_9APHY|nr:hypothetical protein OBBRIDRAFT_44109 [Obba rivulosa]